MNRQNRSIVAAAAAALPLLTAVVAVVVVGYGQAFVIDLLAAARRPAHNTGSSLLLWQMGRRNINQRSPNASYEKNYFFCRCSLIATLC